MHITIRQYNKLTDEAFLYESWIKNTRVRACPVDLVVNGQRNRINRLLRRPDINIQVACLDENTDLILGYIVMEGPNRLHWIYVKGKYRQAGIARELLRSLNSEGRIQYSYKPYDIELINKLKSEEGYHRYVYNPYLLEEP